MSGASVSVCMIVKDGEATIARAIESVRPFVSEVCVYESRSTDGTLALLEQLAAQPGSPIRFVRGGWCDDYGWAWRQAFAMVSPEVGWVLWLEDDEYLVDGGALDRLDRLPADVDHVYVRRDHLYADGNVLKTWQVRATRPGACEWRGRVHEELAPRNELAFAAFLPDVLRVAHPRDTPAGDPVTGARVDGPILAAAALPDASPWLRFHYVSGVCERRGDLTGAEVALRGYLDATDGKHEWGRYTVRTRLAAIVVRRGAVLESLAVIQARDAELEQWRVRAAAGELVGLESLGPDFWPSVNAVVPPVGVDAAFALPPLNGEATPV